MALTIKQKYFVLYSLFLSFLLPRHFNSECEEKTMLTVINGLDYHADVVISIDFVCDCRGDKLEMRPKWFTAFKTCISCTERSLT